MSWDHFPSFITPDLWLDDAHAIQFMTREGETKPSEALFCHRDKRNPDEWCIGGFQWRSPNPAANWTLVSLSPLHVEPSIHCLTCGEHGWVRDGKWIQA